MTSSDAIEISGLSCRFGRVFAVDQLNLNVPRGAVYGFLGLNGAGKTTTIRSLMGLQLPGSGSLRVLGLDPVKQPLAVREAVGYVPDVPRFIEWMTLHELMALVAHYRPSRWNHRRAHHLVATFDLTLGQRVDTMSKGQRAKVALLLALAFEPEVLILDEPIGGLDPLARRNFFESVLREYMDGDQTVFISSHLINEIAGLVDHVGILKNGRLMRSQPTEELLAGLRRVRLTFDGAAPLPADVRAVRMQAEGRNLEVIIDAFEAARDLPPLQALKPSMLDVQPLTLEDAFVELMQDKAVPAHLEVAAS